MRGAHPDVSIWTAAIDESLDERAFIVPWSRRRRRPSVWNEVIGQTMRTSPYKGELIGGPRTDTSRGRIGAVSAPE